MLFRVCVDNRMFRDALKVFDYVMTKGLVVQARSCFMLFLALKRCNEVEFCVRFFRRMVESSHVDIGVQSLTVMVDVLCKRGKVGRAKELMKEMTAGNVRMVSALFDEMILRGIVPNTHTFGELISRVCKVGQMEVLKILLEEMQSKGVDLIVVIFNMMMDGYYIRGMVDKAFRLQDTMERKRLEVDVFIYNILASWLCKLHEEANRVLTVMVKKGVAPNVMTCTTFIEIYCKEGNLAEVERNEKVKRAYVLQAEIIEKGLLPDVFTYTSLILGEYIVDKVDEALKLFNEMQ
ncbi:Pentatricopeptide repeat-containing protein [Glycine soja]|uniref:Pentatricopeptide repeat-containing protein n=1 Tax=Glycine soja TaxID=3848 RepID=A0A0B2QUW6_GLYSO|nr:Pentatricopeptide repeat-containing protein [Glycine soja]